MAIFDGKPRSWESQLAGIRASGLLVAGGLVTFVILIGIVTLKTWPGAGDLLPGAGHDASLQSTATPAPRPPAQASNLNLVGLLGGTGAAAPGGSARGGTGGGNAVTPGGNGGALGGSPGQPGAGGGQPQGAPPPSSSPQPPPPSSQQPANPVSQLLASTGDAVENTTNNLGDSLGGSSSPGLGGVVAAVGSAVNNDLQSLAGEH